MQMVLSLFSTSRILRTFGLQQKYMPETKPWGVFYILEMTVTFVESIVTNLIGSLS